MKSSRLAWPFEQSTIRHIAQLVQSQATGWATEVGARDFSLPHIIQTSLPSSGYQGVKLTSHLCLMHRLRMVELYLHPLILIYLHGMVLN
jgi:hypothetical protein